MTEVPQKQGLKMIWTRVSVSFLPFADAASAELGLARLLRLSLFQISVGMAMALTFGTLNRVMIVELDVSATLVAVMVALPLVFAPFRAFIGFKSDNHESALGWRRVPYIWFGTMLQFGGLAIMPFALLVLSGDSGAPVNVGKVAAAFAFLLMGAGVQTTQTAGLALATDLAPEESRPKVVALMYVMLLVGISISGIVFAGLLTDFSPLRLIQVVQGAAFLTMVFNIIALWKQEARNPAGTAAREIPLDFKTEWRAFMDIPDARRFLIAVGLGTAAFNIQDILLEPYGGEVLKLAVAQTSLLTALLSVSALVAYGIAARALGRGFDAFRLAAYGVVAGLPGFAAIVLAAPLESAALFRVGVALIGFGGGLFAVATLTAAMGIEKKGRTGLALGAWGAIQATCGGLGIAFGGALRDAVSGVASVNHMGPTMSSAATAYSSAYIVEIVLLFATLIAIGPLARYSADKQKADSDSFQLATFPS
jgi:BCD family chlorophyll transporter-like MFS transporter